MFLAPVLDQTYLDERLPAYFVATTTVAAEPSRIEVSSASRGPLPRSQEDAIWTEVWFDRGSTSFVLIVPRGRLAPYPSLAAPWRRGEAILVGSDGIVRAIPGSRVGDSKRFRLSAKESAGLTPRAIYDRYSPRRVKKTDVTGEVYVARSETVGAAPLKSGVDRLAAVWTKLGPIKVG